MEALYLKKMYSTIFKFFFLVVSKKKKKKWLMIWKHLLYKFWGDTSTPIWELSVLNTYLHKFMSLGHTWIDHFSFISSSNAVFLQIGHEFFIDNHLLMHPTWKSWLHDFKLPTSSIFTYSSCQTRHVRILSFYSHEKQRLYSN